MNTCPRQLPQQCIDIKSFCLKIQNVMPGVQKCDEGGVQRSDNIGKCEYKNPCVNIKTREECENAGKGYIWCGQ